jgi:hypothetical protein
MASMEDSDPFVAIWEGPTTEGAPLARHLEAALIPVNLGDPPAPGHLRIEVPRSYLPEALGVLDRAGDSEPPPIIEEDDLLPLEESGWPWPVQVALGLIAAGLVVLLLVNSR